MSRASSNPEPRVGLAATLFAVSAAACWGFGIVAAKAALDEGVSPLTLLILQLSASVAMLIIIVGARRSGALGAQLRDMRAAAGTGVLEYGATYALGTFGLALTTAGNAAIIGTAEPALIVLVAALVLRERIGPRLLAILGLVTCGLVLVSLSDIRAAGTPSTGDMLVLMSAATGALYAVFSRTLVARISPVVLALVQQAAGLLAITLVTALVIWSGVVSLGLNMLSALALALAVLSGLLQHSGAVWLHLHALKRMPAGSFAPFLALIPVFALSGAALGLGEVITMPQLLGGGLIVAAAASAYGLTSK